jgi:hypothetical protein
MSRKVQKLFKKYIKFTDKGAFVENVKVLVGRLPDLGIEVGIFFGGAVFISSKVIKHTYDKRPAQEFDILLKNLRAIIRFPDRLYRNKSGKRGSFCTVKQINETLCFCAIENTQMGFEMVTFFKIEESYLKDYELLWEWKDGTPSS